MELTSCMDELGRWADRRPALDKGVRAVIEGTLKPGDQLVIKFGLQSLGEVSEDLSPASVTGKRRTNDEVAALAWAFRVQAEILLAARLPSKRRRRRLAELAAAAEALAEHAHTKPIAGTPASRAVAALQHRLAGAGVEPAAPKVAPTPGAVARAERRRPRLNWVAGAVAAAAFALVAFVQFGLEPPAVVPRSFSSAPVWSVIHSDGEATFRLDKTWLDGQREEIEPALLALRIEAAEAYEEPELVLHIETDRAKSRATVSPAGVSWVP